MDTLHPTIMGRGIWGRELVLSPARKEPLFHCRKFQLTIIREVDANMEPSLEFTSMFLALESGESGTFGGQGNCPHE